MNVKIKMWLGILLIAMTSWGCTTLTKKKLVGIDDFVHLCFPKKSTKQPEISQQLLPKPAEPRCFIESKTLRQCDIKRITEKFKNVFNIDWWEDYRKKNENRLKSNRLYDAPVIEIGTIKFDREDLPIGLLKSGLIKGMREAGASTKSLQEFLQEARRIRDECRKNSWDSKCPRSLENPTYFVMQGRIALDHQQKPEIEKKQYTLSLNITEIGINKPMWDAECIYQKQIYYE